MSKEKKILSTREANGVNYRTVEINVEYGIGKKDEQGKELKANAVGECEIFAYTKDLISFLNSTTVSDSAKFEIHTDLTRQQITDAENTLRRIEREKALQPHKATLKQTTTLVESAMKFGLDINAIISAAIAQAAAKLQVEADVRGVTVQERLDEKSEEKAEQESVEHIGTTLGGKKNKK